MNTKAKTNSGFEFYLEPNPSKEVLLKSIKHINKNILTGSFRYLMRNQPFSHDLVNVWHEEQASGKVIRVVGLDGATNVISTAYLCRGHGNNNHTAKLGITVEPSCQNKGVAYTTCSNLLKLGKENGILRVESQPVIENTSAVKLLLRLGFVSEGVAIKKFRANDSRHIDCLHMAKMF